MPRLNVLAPDQATGTVKELYNGFEAKLGKVINIFKGMGNSGAALQAYVGLSSALAGGELSPEDLEAIYLSVSERNQCGYCVSAHTMLAIKACLSDEEIIEFRKGGSSDEKRNALIDFTFKVMDTKGFVEDADIEAVREAGYNDAQIAETIGFISLATYTNLFNHVFDTELDFPQAPSL